MAAPARIETAAVQYGELTVPESMPTDFDRLIQGSVNQLIFSDARMDRMMKMAEILAKGKVTVPQHLQNNVGDCMAIVLQAAQWNMDPFAVAQKTHLISGKLGYEAQLVNAVIITRAPVTGRPQYEWFGDWAKVIGKFRDKTNAKGETYRVPGWTLEDEKGLGIRIWMTMRGETDPRVLELLLTQATVRNSTLWAGDPKQQLAYLAIKRWARLYCPDVLLGVYSADELESPELAPAPVPATGSTATARLKSRLAAPQPAPVPPPPPGMDAETGEVADAEPVVPVVEPEDPIADLLLVISEAQTIADLEANREAVAALKNGIKRRAVAAWTAKKEALIAAGHHAYPAPE
jgi:hypothetical protein